MKITVYAKPNAKETLVERIDDEEFVVSVKEPPRDGKANQAIVRALADHFGVAAARVRIVSGLSAKLKIVEIV